MLQPANRLTLIDAMRPPAGFCFESAMAVTFTLDLQALLAAPAALALTGHRGNSTDAYDDTREPEIIHALRSHADKLTVFSQAGEMALPPSRRAFAFLERVVIPVTSPRGGIVHPKVWVIRYQPAASRLTASAGSDTPEKPLRVLVASRNLTFDASWDTVLRLDEAVDSNGAVLAPLSELFEGLLSIADDDVGRVSADHRQRVVSLSAALRHAQFALPDGVDDIRVHVLGLAQPSSPLPRGTERSLIISPFVSDDFFRVHDTSIDELVSRSESLDRLAQDSLSKVSEVQFFDDTSAVDLDADDERRTRFDPGQFLTGLHAKIFAFEQGAQARLFLGSANATGAAFDRNVEILLELIGPAAAIGVDRLCEGVEDEKGNRRGLRDFFYEYRGPSPDDGADEESRSTFDRLRRAIAQLAFEGTVEPSDTEWAVTYRTTEPVLAPGGVTIHCWPLTVTGNRREIAVGKRLQERFETSLENLSGFLAFELANDEGNTSSFVVPIPLVDVPEERDRRLLRSLIGKQFFRYLLALLEDSPGEIDPLEAVERTSSAADGTDPTGPMSLPVLEKLLRTMRRDPGKLAGLHPLVSDLAADDSLPEGFAELWTTIHDVATAETTAQ